MLHEIMRGRMAASAIHLAKVDRRSFLRGGAGFALAAYALPADAFTPALPASFLDSILSPMAAME